MKRVNIFQFGRVLDKNFPELVKYDSPEIDLAIEDLANTEKSIQKIISELNKLKRHDYNGLAQILTDLENLFEHTNEHLKKAKPKLSKLQRIVHNKI